MHAKLNEHRYFRVGKEPRTLYVSISHYRDSTEVITYYPDNKMTCETGPHPRLRKLLHHLRRQMAFGQRIENPEPGVDFVEAISLDEYWNVKRQHLDWQWAREAQAVLRRKQKRPA